MFDTLSFLASMVESVRSGFRPPMGWFLYECEFEHGVVLDFIKGKEHLIIELDEADESRPCFARTVLFNIYYSRIYRREDFLDASESELLFSLVNFVRKKEIDIPNFEVPSVHRRCETREITVSRFLMKEPLGSYYINPYIGCTIGCQFCFAAHRVAFSRKMAGMPEIPWGRHVQVKINAPEVLAREIESMPPGAVRISPIVTDPYQPLERKYRITRQCLEVLRHSDFAPVILTRSKLIVEDLELIRSFPEIAVGFSIPTDDERIRSLFEPGADSIEDRVEAVKTMYEAGIKVFLFVQPVLPCNPERLAEMLGPYVSKIRIDRMSEIQRTQDIYYENGFSFAMGEKYYNEVSSALKYAFASFGVSHSPIDDLSEIIIKDGEAKSEPSQEALCPIPIKASPSICILRNV